MTNRYTRKAHGWTAHRARILGREDRSRTIAADDVRVLLTTCPLCGAGGGDRCRRVNNTVTVDPHPERVRAAAGN